MQPKTLFWACQFQVFTGVVTTPLRKTCYKKGSGRQGLITIYLDKAACPIHALLRFLASRNLNIYPFPSFAEAELNYFSNYLPSFLSVSRIIGLCHLYIQIVVFALPNK